jgi:hypothetical protein
MMDEWCPPSADVFQDDSVADAKNDCEKKGGLSPVRKKARVERRRKRIGDPNGLPMRRNHINYAFVDSRDYHPATAPAHRIATTARINKWGDVWGCYFPVGTIKDQNEWPTHVSFDRMRVENPKRRMQLDPLIVSFSYKLDKGLIGAGPYRIHLQGRVFEEGTLRAGLLRPRYYHVSTFNPRYLIGITSRCEAFVDCCYEYNNALLQTYQLSLIEPPLPPSPDSMLQESMYHGVQHLWYYKEKQHDMRQWMLGFKNLQIDKFGVPPEPRPRYGRGRKDAQANLSPLCFGKGTFAVYQHMYYSERRKCTSELTVTEVARYFWYGEEKTLNEYLSLVFDQSPAIAQYVTHIKDIGILILAYAIDACFYSCTPTIPSSGKTWAQVVQTHQ